MEYNKVQYNKEYNRKTYWRPEVLIRKENKEKVVNHMKSKGYTKFSAYVNHLIDKDITGGGKSVKRNLKFQLISVS